MKNKILSGERIWILSGKKCTALSPIEFAQLMEQKGAGEIIIQSMHHDGMMKGYDIDLIKRVSSAVSISTIALGGAGKDENLIKVHQNGYASGLAAGSLFVYQSANRGVLINYPSRNELNFTTGSECRKY